MAIEAFARGRGAQGTEYACPVSILYDGKKSQADPDNVCVHRFVGFQNLTAGPGEGLELCVKCDILLLAQHDLEVAQLDASRRLQKCYCYCFH